MSEDEKLPVVLTPYGGGINQQITTPADIARAETNAKEAKANPEKAEAERDVLSRQIKPESPETQIQE